MKHSRQALSLAGRLGVGVAIGWTTLISACTDPAPLSDSPPELMADSLIGRWIDAVGGMSAYDDFQSTTYTITTVLFDTLTGRVKRTRPRYVWMKKSPEGYKVRVERWEPAGFIAQGFNGLEEWATLDGAMLPDTAKDWREVRYVAGDLYYWPGLPFKLRDGGVFLNYQGLTSRPGAELRTDPQRAEIPGRQNAYHDVQITFGENVGDHQDVWHYYFLPGEAFPTEVTYTEEDYGTLNRLIWGETIRHGDIRYPSVTRRDWITLSGKRTKALVISDMVINPEIPDRLFERPVP